MVNDFDAHYNVDVDRRGNIENIAASTLNRRQTLARLVAASATLLGGSSAFAADAPPPPEFSESPTSESSIARMGYDGKGAPVEATAAEADVEEAAPPVEENVIEEVETTKEKADFDGNEAGSVGGGDGAAWAKKADPQLTIPNLNLPVGELISQDDFIKIAGGSVAVMVVAALANGGEDEGDDTPINPLAKSSPPPAEPYGLSSGRNYWEGVDMTAAKKAGLVSSAPVKPPPAPAAVVQAPEPVKVELPAADRVWKMSAPTPYGIQNKGSNPFVQNVLEYCEGGKVTEPCTETIKEYLDDIADTGAVATTEEVKTIAGYLDALGSDDASSATGGSPGAAFASYLDALSEGSAPPPSSAKAVKTYLDTLNGTGDSAVAPVAVAPEQPVAPAAPVVAAVEPAPEPVAVVATASPDFSIYDNRLISIEDRVTSLEGKVDDLPDQVFAKIEAWQTQQEGRLTEEVKKVVNALAPPPAAEPVAVVEAPSPVPEPVVVIPQPVVAVPEPVAPPAPVVKAAPFAAAIPDRSGMPGVGGATKREYAKKGFGFGGNAGWKTGETSSSSSGGGYLDNMSP